MIQPQLSSSTVRLFSRFCKLSNCLKRDPFWLSLNDSFPCHVIGDLPRSEVALNPYLSTNKLRILYKLA